MKHTLTIALMLFILLLFNSCAFAHTIRVFSISDSGECEFSSTERELPNTTQINGGIMTINMSNSSYPEDVLQSVYITEAVFVLPSGRTIKQDLVPILK